MGKHLAPKKKHELNFIKKRASDQTVKAKAERALFKAGKDRLRRERPAWKMPELPSFGRHTWIFQALSLALLILLSSIPAQADDGYASGTTLLRSLTHNCPNTGIMLPETFNPYQTTYLLTVASWVSRPTFTPVAMDPSASIFVNGQYVRSGETSPVIPMTDAPQAVTIQVSNGTGSTVYTVYLQRRPSERRTRVSAGYIQNIYLKGTTWHIDADLVTVKYSSADYTSGRKRKAGADLFREFPREQFGF